MQDQLRKMQRDNAQFTSDIIRLREDNSQLQRRYDQEVTQRAEEFATKTRQLLDRQLLDSRRDSTHTLPYGVYHNITQEFEQPNINNLTNIEPSECEEDNYYSRIKQSEKRILNLFTHENSNAKFKHQLSVEDLQLDLKEVRQNMGFSPEKEERGATVSPKKIYPHYPPLRKESERNPYK